MKNGDGASGGVYLIVKTDARLGKSARWKRKQEQKFRSLFAPLKVTDFDPPSSFLSLPP